MNLTRPGIFSVLLILTLGSLAASNEGGCQPQWISPSSRMLGTQAPNFTLPALKGEKVELSTITAEKPVLLIFWATWCPTCVEEIPTLNEWHQKYKNLAIFGINVQESNERVKVFKKKKKMLYPILLDGEGEVAGQFGLVGIPAAILLAKGGKIIYFGFSLPQNIEQIIKE